MSLAFDVFVELLTDFLCCDYYLQGIDMIVLVLSPQDNYCNEVQSVC